MNVQDSLLRRFAGMTLSGQRMIFSGRQQEIFLEDMYALLEDGVSLNQAVQTLMRLSQGPTLLLVQEIHNALASGQLFADALPGWFSAHLVAIIRAGERSGTFMQTLLVAKQAIAQQNQVWSRVLATLTYPVTVMLMGCAVAVFIRQSVLSSFAQIKPVTMWPALGQQLYVLAWWLQTYGLLMLSLCALLGVLVAFTLRWYTGSWRRYLDHLPFFNGYRQLVAARTMEVMGLMLSNGLSLRDVLRLCQESATPYLRWHLLHMEQRLSSGQESIALVLQTGLLQAHELARLRVVAQGNGFAAAMCRLGQRAHARCQQAMVRSARLASGVLLVCAAGFAALMVLAVYSVGSFVGT